MALPPSRSDGTPFPCTLTEDEYKAKLTGSQYRCLRQGGTEAYRRGEFCNFFPEDGYMACDRPRPKKPRSVHFRRERRGRPRRAFTTDSKRQFHPA